MVRHENAIDTDTFRRYLQGHLAGAAVGLAIATRLADSHQGTALGDAMEALGRQIEEERAMVDSALRRLPSKPDVLRRTTQILGAAGARAGALPFVPAPSLLEDLEALAVGVWGKRLLWGALRRADLPDGNFSDLPLDRLSEAAERQEREIVRLREDLLAAAFPVEA